MGRLLAEHDGDTGAALREVIWLDDLPVGFVDAAAAGSPLYFVHTDHLGSPRKLSDAGGAPAWDGVFGPFGEVISVTGALAQNLRFPGQYHDSESALSYNWRRTYDPSLGRYLQNDPIGLAGRINTYAYVGGNPLIYTDPEVLNPAAGAVLGGVAAGPPGAVAGLAIGGAVIIGAVILSEIIDGPDDPAGKAASDAQKAEEECKKNCDKQYYDIDIPVCRSIAKKRGKVAGARCYKSAADRYEACLAGKPRPPLDTYNN